MMHRFLLPQLSQRWLVFAAIAPVTLLAGFLSNGLFNSFSSQSQVAIAQATQPTEGRPLTLRSDIQEANANTGVITARGNVQIYYPARQIQATAAQAQYFSRERRIILTGDVYVLQQGNSLRGETITYLIDEGRFVALPQAPKQVEAIYLLQEAPSPSPTPAAAPIPTPVVEPFGQPEFSAPSNSTDTTPTP
uniref:OstA family protein n=1 Tax=Oscillatoriales cyanobacterium SpSt-402 TaxID=2282168 RepID=A0A832H315_9CYAN